MKFIHITLDPAQNWVHKDGSSDYREPRLYALGDDGSLWTLRDPAGWHPNVATSWEAIELPRACTDSPVPMIDCRSLGAGFSETELRAAGVDFASWERGFNDAVDAVRSKLEGRGR